MLYATLHLPVEPNGYYAYNALQQLVYFGVVFVMAPLAILTGVAMSPAIDNALPWYPRIFGGRQGARSIHFLLLCGYVIFTIVHVGLVMWSGIAQWGGISMVRLIGLVKPLPSARVVEFISFGDGTFGGVYYDTQRIEDVVKPECLLAYEMNDVPLPLVHGAPVRLRVENQLGFKMVKGFARFASSRRRTASVKVTAEQTKIKNTSTCCLISRWRRVPHFSVTYFVAFRVSHGGPYTSNSVSPIARP